MNVLIWGTGNFGDYVKCQLKKNNDVVIKKFIDSDPMKWGKEIDGITIISVDDVSKYCSENDVILIAITNGISIYEEAKTVCNCKIGVVRNRVLEARLMLNDNLLNDDNILWSDAPFLKKPILHSLETNIVDSCNLNCRGCSHFANLFERSDMVPFETFCADLKKIADNTYVYRFNMLGGEVLLNERVIEYIEYVAALMPYTDIELITNGLLLPKQDKSFFECCKKHNVAIVVSGYKPTLAMREDIVKVLEENGVVYIFWDDVEDFGKNIDLSGKNEADVAMKQCRENNCHSLRKGKLYKCPFEALGNKFFSHYNLDIRLNGGIDIYEENLDWAYVVDVLRNKSIDACRYCGKEERIEWRVTNNPCIEDWII